MLLGQNERNLGKAAVLEIFFRSITKAASQCNVDCIGAFVLRFVHVQTKPKRYYCVFHVPFSKPDTCMGVISFQRHPLLLWTFADRQAAGKMDRQEDWQITTERDAWINLDRWIAIGTGRQTDRDRYRWVGKWNGSLSLPQTHRQVGRWADRQVGTNCRFISRYMGI